MRTSEERSDNNYLLGRCRRMDSHVDSPQADLEPAEMTCRCLEVIKPGDDAAQAYIASHQVKLRSLAAGWEIEHECPMTRIRWLLDYPNSRAARWSAGKTSALQT